MAMCAHCTGMQAGKVLAMSEMSWIFWNKRSMNGVNVRNGYSNVPYCLMQSVICVRTCYDL